MSSHSNQYEYVVVGSGAGGGVVAARLAEAGHKVLLLEAGGDPLLLKGGGPVGPDRLPADYSVPTFHTMASENEAMRWDFFVRHYADIKQQERDDKFVKQRDGVLYPRAGTLGGCTAHNAMIMVYPHNDDWNEIAKLTGDPSWGADNMRHYFERMENCRHRPPYRWLKKLTGWNPTRHGFSGWLTIEKALPKTALADHNLIKIVIKSALTEFVELAHRLKRLFWAIGSQFDPNDWRLVKNNAEGLRYAPLSTHHHARNGTREFILDVARRYPDRLTIELNALVTKVLLDDANRTLGVAYLKGERLYRAHAEPSTKPGTERKVHVSREVILSGGAFNTPQLLMLSGVGAKEELERHGIEVRVNLPGVGKNLQDRYEVGVANELKEEWKVLKGAKFSEGDPQFEQWNRIWRKGVYTTNGAALAIIKKSDPKRRLPDLFIFAVLGFFKGYFPGYSKLVADNLNYLTWTILKAHTNNRGGTVTLRSSDPRDPPQINFHYFQEGTDKSGEDLESVVDGIEFVRTLTAPIRKFIVKEELPGKNNQSRQELKQFIQNNAWGHHASCTCPIGPITDKMAVLDNNFRVYGTSGLRVVDASVFPRIPGLFVVTPVYMIGEKASDAILADAGHAILAPGTYGNGWRKFFKCLKWGIMRAAKAVLGVLAVLLAVIAVIVAASWFIFEPPSANPDQEKEKQTIADIIRVLTGKLEDQYKNTPKFLRDTHPKANACVKANFTLEPKLADNLGIGVFKGKANGERSYKAWVRLSNAADHVTADTETDFRGMAVKLFGVEGEKLPVPGDEKDTQDFLFIAHDTFFAGEPRHFHDFFAACVKGGGSCDPKKNPYLLWHFLTHPRGAFNIMVGRKVYPSIADINWFSVALFKLGDKQVVKYSAFPCEQQVSYGRPGTESYYLQKRLKDQLDPAYKGHLCLDFMVQIQADPGSQPIENTLVAWSDQVSPWHKVATIDIYPQEFTSDAQAAFCERITFNPWHSRMEHMPLGGINRARRDVMHAMQDVRLKANSLTRFGPTELTGNEVFK